MCDPYPRHHPVLIALHWLTAMLVTLSVAILFGREWIEGHSLRQWLLDAHRVVGLVLLLITLTRLALRPLVGTPEVTGDLPLLWARLAKLSHGGLYFLLLTLPILGWAGWSASGKDMRLFGVLLMPSLPCANPDLAEALDDWHQGLAWVLVGLAATHALAALWHHFGRHDQVLRSMLPARSLHPLVGLHQPRDGSALPTAPSHHAISRR